MDSHGTVCVECLEFSNSAGDALGVLRMAAIDPQVSDGFDERLIRRIKVQTVRQGLSYWSPALIAGAIACIALVATLQIVAAPIQLKKATLPEGEARVGGNAEKPFPSLILDTKPRLR